jgi:hypothetical protein
MNTRALGTVMAAALMLGCHTITEELPTQPSKTPSNKGVVTIAIPVIPGATPAPTPVPTPQPTATPGPAPTPTPPPGTGSCGNPIPPPVSRMNTKVHIRGANKWTLDTTPIVGPDGDYCRKIGFTDGRLFCAVRTEGSPDREACEEYAIGRAVDTKRPGPTWYRNGQLCNGTDCENHEDNQYLLYALAGGRYEACTKDGICGAVDVDR